MNRVSFDAVGVENWQYPDRCEDLYRHVVTTDMDVDGRSLACGGPSAGSKMISEFDLPCTDCGRDLVARELGGASASASSEALTVAECPSCGGRYYPDETLRRLTVDDLA